MNEAHDNTLVAIARLEERVCGVSNHLARIDTHFERIEELFRSSMTKAADDDEKREKRFGDIEKELAENRGAVNAIKWLLGFVVAGLAALAGFFGLHASKGH